MPTSVSMYDKAIETWLKEHPYGHYIDIGPGEGRIGKLIHQTLPSAKVTGIEIEKRYIDMYNLYRIYDDIIGMDALDYFRDKESDNFDVIFWMDGPEHFKKSDGVDLLHFLAYRTRYMVITFPSRYKQGRWEGFLHEAHLSVWSENDFLEFDHEYYTTIGDNNIPHNLCIMEGFREK